MLVCMGLVLAWNVTNYMLTSYMPTYVTATMPDMQGGSSVSETTSQILQIVVMAVALVTIPLLGRLSDRIGRKPIVWVGSIGLIVLSLPAILLIRAQTGVTIFLGLLIMGLLLICFSATMPSTLPSLFPTRVRGGALSIAFNVSVSLFGGTTSVVVGALVSATGDLNWPAYYLIATGVIGAVSIYFTQESNGRHLWGSSPAADSDAGGQGAGGHARLGGLAETDTCERDSAVNSVPAQSACRLSSSKPASCAIRSSSAGQM